MKIGRVSDRGEKRGRQERKRTRRIERDTEGGGKGGSIRKSKERALVRGERELEKGKTREGRRGIDRKRQG